MSEELISPQGTIKLGDTTYLVSKPTEKDIFCIYSYAKKQAKKLYNPIKKVLDTINGLEVSKDIIEKLILQAGRVSQSEEVPDEAITDFLISPAGASFYTFILCRKNHPEIKLEDIEKLITEANSVTIFAELDEASGVKLIHKALEDSDFFPQP
jgi:hypothetical protein